MLSMVATCRKSTASLLVVLACLSGSACAARPARVPAGVIVGAAAALPSPRIDSNDAPPQLLGMHFSSLNVGRGQTWTGQFVTGSSVASVEVRTNLFSIDVPRAGVGRFAFVLRVLDVPPIFIRRYRLRVIARNSAGLQIEQDLPFAIR